MVDLENLLTQIIDINEKYKNLEEADSAKSLLEKYRSFRIRVPLIGHFSAGKSYLLSATLDQTEPKTLLPCGLTRKTLFPTEISYSPEQYAQYFVNDEQYPVGKMDLLDFREEKYRDKEDRHEVTPTKVQIFLNRGLLQELPKIALVDVPGLDSGIEAHDCALNSGLQEGSAYIFVFSADNPALTETMRQSLQSLIHGKEPFPTLVVLTKCDQVGDPEEIERIEEHFEHELDEILPENWDYYMVHTGKGMPDCYEKVRGFLRDLQKREDQHGEFLYARMNPLVLHRAEITLRYLEGQIKALEMTDGENGEKSRKIQEKIERLRETLIKEKGKLEEMIPHSVDAAIVAVHNLLESNIDHYVDRIYTSRKKESEMAAFQRELNTDICMTVQNSIAQNCSESLQAYAKSIDGELLSFRYALSGSTDDSIGGKIIDVSAASVAILVGSDLMLGTAGGTVAAALTSSGIGAALASAIGVSAMPVIGAIFAAGGVIFGLIKSINRKKNAKREIEESLRRDVYPKIEGKLRETLNAKLTEETAKVTQKVEREAERQIALLEKAEKDARQLQKADKEERDKKKTRLSVDIDQLRRAM